MHDGVQRGVLRVAGETENLHALQEKRPLFVVEEIVAQVDVHLPRVRLHLAEIGVIRGIQGHSGGQSHLGGEADIPMGIGGSHCAFVKCPLAGIGKSRQEFHHAFEF